ncbi:hypothetical protein PR202_gb15436 [Eleusine coracana subsp. coracana]|uniref:Endoplasmic reticulum vesicle transporter C-terminal domain-containing protein n=1 Tax=Eleusine coracana subsp. coracana TaxID=191504 RepID=A0AAV5EY85_ELECO|nr:hypothetical protein PR202_gb15436 [Eleusine coracana subsp. coracana]
MGDPKTAPLMSSIDALTEKLTQLATAITEINGQLKLQATQLSVLPSIKADLSDVKQQIAAHNIAIACLEKVSSSKTDADSKPIEVDGKILMDGSNEEDKPSEPPKKSDKGGGDDGGGGDGDDGGGGGRGGGRGRNDKEERPQRCFPQKLHRIRFPSDGQCCNTCEDVREAYRKKGWGVSNPDLLDQCKREGFLQSIKDEEGEGCNIYGFIEVNKVAGNFHFAPGKSFQQSNVHVHDLLPFQKDSFNVSHRINKLSFGESFPGVVNPLDGAHWVQHSSYGMYQYFIKVVPTVYTDINERIILSNQVTFIERHVSFLHFLTNVCAIVGGVFTVSGIIDSFVYHGQRAIKKKMEIGKFN